MAPGRFPARGEPPPLLGINLTWETRQSRPSRWRRRRGPPIGSRAAPKWPRPPLPAAERGGDAGGGGGTVPSARPRGVGAVRTVPKGRPPTRTPRARFRDAGRRSGVDRGGPHVPPPPRLLEAARSPRLVPTRDADTGTSPTSSPDGRRGAGTHRRGHRQGIRRGGLGEGEGGFCFPGELPGRPGGEGVCSGPGPDTFPTWLPPQTCCRPSGIEIRLFLTRIIAHEGSPVKRGWGECLGDFCRVPTPPGTDGGKIVRVSPQMIVSGGGGEGGNLLAGSRGHRLCNRIEIPLFLGF